MDAIQLALEPQSAYNIKSCEDRLKGAAQAEAPGSGSA